MNLEKVKKHVRVDHSFEDDLLAQYMVWAESEVKDSVSTSENINDEYFFDNPHFERAVILLTAHYFENRLPLTETSFTNLPFGVDSAIQKLRGGYYEVE